MAKLCCVRLLRVFENVHAGRRKKALVQWETMCAAHPEILSWETMRTCLDGYWMGNRTACALLFGTKIFEHMHVFS